MFNQQFVGAIFYLQVFKRGKFIIMKESEILWK